jgi:hypothetical protein
MVLLGLGLFVAGILTGATALYWGCVAACVVAAALLIATRRQLTAAEASSAAKPADSATTPPEPPATSAGSAGSAGGEGGTTTTSPGGSTGAGRGMADRKAAEASAASARAAVPEELEDPPVEEVEVTDLLLVVDLKDDVLVVDERPRYHLAGCAHLAGRTPIPLPLDEARADGFTPCAVCAPDRALAERVRARKHDADSS